MAGCDEFPQFGERKTPRTTCPVTGSGSAWLSPILSSRNEINFVTTDSTEVDPIEIEIEIAFRDPTANTSCNNGAQGLPITNRSNHDKSLVLKS